MCFLIEADHGVCTDGFDGWHIVRSTSNVQCCAATYTLLVDFNVMVIKEFAVDAGMVVADGDGERGVTIANKVDISTMIEKIIENW